MITSIQLRCFKSFRQAEFPLSRLTIIVGTNASGKSNLRDALRFVHGISRRYTLADIVGEKFEAGVPVWQGVRGGVREIAYTGNADFAVKSYLSVPAKSRDGKRVSIKFEHNIQIGVREGSRPLYVIRESLYRHQKMLFDSHPQQEPPTQAKDPLHIAVRLPKVGGQRRRGTSRTYLSDQPVLSQAVNDDEAPPLVRTYSSQVLAELATFRFLDLAPDAMRVPSVPGQPLGSRGENLSSVLQELCAEPSTRASLMEWVNQLTPMDVSDFEFTLDAAGRVLLSLVEANGQRTSAHSASDGTLRFLAMLAMLFSPGAGRVFFLEEIDNGIHPTRLALLLELIEQLAKRNRLQVIATTHSPQLLGMLSRESRENALLVARLPDSPESVVRRLVEIPHAHEVFQKHSLSRLHESGWFENVLDFTREESPSS